MKQHNYSFTKKATAAFLSAIIFAVILAGMIGIYYMVENDYYSSTFTQVKKSVQSEMILDEIDKAADIYIYGSGDPAQYFENTNFEFTITDQNGYVLLSTYSGAEPECEETREIYLTADGSDLPTYTVTGYIVPSAG